MLSIMDISIPPPQTAGGINEPQHVWMHVNQTYQPNKLH